MPRLKTSPTKFVNTSDSHESDSTWVFLMKENSLETKDESLSNIVNLRHPASNKPAMFIFGPEDLTIQEVLNFNENKRSWFIDDSVKSNGNMYLSTPVDPTFLALPYLRKSDQMVPVEQFLWDKDYPEIIRLAHCQNLKLSAVADYKGTESFQAYKYNEEKTLNWLQKKVERVAEVLKQKGIHVSQGAVSATYVKSSKYESSTEIEYLRYAHGIVSEYLTDDLAKKLIEHLKIPEELRESKKRKLSNSDNEVDEKKVKKEESVTLIGVSNFITFEKPPKTPTVSKKELARQKAAVGSKSITSFFQKK